VTDPDLDDVLARELLLMDPAVRADPGRAAALLDPAFREFGSSGRVWDAASILAALAADAGTTPEVRDAAATRLAPDVVLLTYRTVRPGRSTLRSSVWRRTDAWRLLFHQGTPENVGPPS